MGRKSHPVRNAGRGKSSRVRSRPTDGRGSFAGELKAEHCSRPVDAAEQRRNGVDHIAVVGEKR